MWRKITVLAVVVSLIVFIVPTGGYAAPDRKVSETVLDDDEYLRARADFERKVEAAGGRVFDSKEKLWQWIVRQGLAEMLGRQFDKLPEADLYLALPTRFVESVDPRLVRDPVAPYQLQPSKWCQYCMAFVIFVAYAILGGIVYDVFKLSIMWVYDELCEQCSGVIYTETTTHTWLCPDCGKQGQPEVWQANDNYVVIYCHRCYGTYYDYNPY